MIKRNAGFDVSITDTWGRALSHQFFPGLDDGGDALTWSTLQDVDVFKIMKCHSQLLLLMVELLGLMLLVAILLFSNLIHLKWDHGILQFINFLKSNILVPKLKMVNHH